MPSGMGIDTSGFRRGECRRDYIRVPECPFGAPEIVSRLNLVAALEGEVAAVPHRSRKPGTSTRRGSTPPPSAISMEGKVTVASRPAATRQTFRRWGSTPLSSATRLKCSGCTPPRHGGRASSILVSRSMSLSSSRPRTPGSQSGNGSSSLPRDTTLPPSSNGLGRWAFNPEIGVRFPSEAPGPARKPSRLSRCSLRMKGGRHGTQGSVP